jgi:hypothetical protein
MRFVACFASHVKQRMSPLLDCLLVERGLTMPLPVLTSSSTVTREDAVSHVLLSGLHVRCTVVLLRNALQNYGATKFCMLFNGNDTSRARSHTHAHTAQARSLLARLSLGSLTTARVVAAASTRRCDRSSAWWCSTSRCTARRCLPPTRIGS